MLARPPAPRTAGLIAAIEAAGGIRALARALGLAHPSVLRWTEVPTRYLLQIEQITGVPREKLRPELYRKRN
jgi:DNA-binding transcriptional regulator YdaS (Cro superfamily)